MMKKLFFFVIVAMSVSACNTVQGIGKDIERGGEAIQNSTK